ncbi:hypothetical protein CEUSTIGMA_g7216.t1 [Chlamydomonas eustigma]|uniref:Cyclin-like domain-containing protein n=1 Tax=Chlamydomonas eustigma TaxID=1157962 RepID=A0A250X9Q4_9CHLO|nr:hypothetical protein CEUSTIGMA_g7216.t1 [Chlamydomonas eustigma]|eukprot:GAX79776.1 hypothetical protein CEUSTIGMA_g7216.t1 [Chlamydomonas eustigma]
MAANYWDTKWARLTTSKQRILDSQLDDKARGLTEDQIVQIKCHFSACISDLVKAYKQAFKVELRQRVTATASIYFRRFYLRNCFCHVDPRLVYVGCVYLASKAEESVLPAKPLVAFMKKHRLGWNYDIKNLLDIEMVIMEDINFDLVVFSPYQSLTSFLRDCFLGDAVGLRAWSILNDSYRTDVSLIHPPYMVAIACIHLAVAHATIDQALADQISPGSDMRSPDLSVSVNVLASPVRSQALVEALSKWTCTLNIDLDQLHVIVADIVFMYERFSNIISVGECNRLLDAVQGMMQTSSLTEPSRPAWANREVQNLSSRFHALERDPLKGWWVVEGQPRTGGFGSHEVIIKIQPGDEIAGLFVPLDKEQQILEELRGLGLQRDTQPGSKFYRVTRSYTFYDVGYGRRALVPGNAVTMRGVL